jgi:hypothetical protein
MTTGWLWREDMRETEPPAAPKEIPLPPGREGLDPRAQRRSRRDEVPLPRRPHRGHPQHRCRDANGVVALIGLRGSHLECVRWRRSTTAEESELAIRNVFLFVGGESGPHSGCRAAPWRNKTERPPSLFRHYTDRRAAGRRSSLQQLRTAADLRAELARRCKPLYLVAAQARIYPAYVSKLINECIT